MRAATHDYPRVWQRFKADHHEQAVIRERVIAELFGGDPDLSAADADSS